MKFKLEKRGAVEIKKRSEYSIEDQLNLIGDAVAALAARAKVALPELDALRAHIEAARAGDETRG